MKNTIFKNYLPLSFLIHGLLVSVFIIAPLLTAENNMPSIEEEIIFGNIAPPAPIPPPPGTGEIPGETDIKNITQANRPDNPENRRPKMETKLLSPEDIPDDIDEEEITTDPIPTGVIGGRDYNGKENIYHSIYEHDFSATEPEPIPTVKRPRLIRRIAPVYPQTAILPRIEGDVVVEAVTDVSGRVAQIRIISGHPLLNDAAIEAVKKWIYEPYIINGFPRPVKFTVTIQFRLKK